MEGKGTATMFNFHVFLGPLLLNHKIIFFKKFLFYLLFDKILSSVIFSSPVDFVFIPLFSLLVFQPSIGYKVFQEVVYQLKDE